MTLEEKAAWLRASGAPVDPPMEDGRATPWTPEPVVLTPVLCSVVDSTPSRTVYELNAIGLANLRHFQTVMSRGWGR